MMSHHMRDVLVTNDSKISAGWLFPVILGVLFTCGNYASQEQRLPVRTPRFWLTMTLFICFFMILFVLTYQCLNRFSWAGSARYKWMKWWYFEWHFTRVSVIRDVVRLLVCWLPMAFMIYPGIRGADAGDMIAMYLGYPTLTRPAGTIWLHHPWLDTVFYGSMVKASLHLTGSPNPGIFFICIIQAVIAAIGFSLLLAWFGSKGITRKVLTWMTVFIAFFPIIPYVVFNVNKDMTYASFLVLYCAMIFIVLDDTKKNVLRNPAFNLFFLLLATIVSQTVKSGVVVVIISGFLMIFVTGSWRRRLLAAMAVVTVILFSSIIAPRVVYPRIHAIKGNTSAALVAPITMMGRTAHLHPNDLTPSEERIFRSYFNYSWKEMGNRYQPFTADPLVSVWGRETKQDAPSHAFVRLWIKEGLKHPLDYIEGYLLLESGWYTFSVIGSQSCYSFLVGVKSNIFNPNLIVEGDTFGLRYGPVEKTWRSKIFQDLYTAQASIPGINMLSMLSLYQSIIPCFALYVLWRKRHYLKGSDWYKGFSAFGLWLLVVASMWFAAVSQSSVSASSSRFVYPTLYLTPAAVLMIIYLVRKSHEKRIDESITVENK